MTQKKKQIIQILFDAITTDLNEKRKVNRKNSTFIKRNEICKKVPRWSYKLMDELEQLGGKIEADNSQIRSRKGKRVIILTNKDKFFKKYKTYRDRGDTENTEQKTKLALRRYSQQSDFRRDIIKGSICAQRRKTVTWNFFQKRVHSPLFLDKIEKSIFFSFHSLKSMKRFFMLNIWIRKKRKKQKKKVQKKRGGSKKGKCRKKTYRNSRSLG